MNAATVVRVDVEARNGVIHVIKSVLMRPAGRTRVPKSGKKY